MKKKLCAALALVTAAFFITSCASVADLSGQPRLRNGVRREAVGLFPSILDVKKKIVVTSFPIYEATQKIIAGHEKRFDLIWLQNDGSDLHSFEPTPEAVSDIRSADLVIYMGQVGDEWIDEIVNGAQENGVERKSINLKEYFNGSLLPTLYELNYMKDSQASEKNQAYYNRMVRKNNELMEKKLNPQVATVSEVDAAIARIGADIGRGTVQESEISRDKKEDSTEEYINQSEETNLTSESNESETEKHSTENSAEETLSDFEMMDDMEVPEVPSGEFETVEIQTTEETTEMSNEEIAQIVYDEHFWLSLSNQQYLTRMIYQIISGMDQKNYKDYYNNTERYCITLENLENEYRVAKRATNKYFVIVPDKFPFRYLFNDFKISYSSVYRTCNKDEEPDLNRIDRLAEIIDERQIPVVIVTEQSDQEIAKQVINKTKTKDQKILVMNSLHTVSQKDIENGVSYLSLMRENLKVIKEALKQ